MRAYTRTRVYSTPMKNKINISETGTEDESESHVHVEEKLALSFSTDPVFTWINSVCSFFRLGKHTECKGAGSGNFLL